MKAIKVQGRAKNLKWDHIEKVEEMQEVGEADEEKTGC
jgi:hypothetical protein